MAHVGDLPEGGPGSDVTVLLRRWSDGDAAALDALLPTVQDELQRLARSYMRREREGHTLEPTALVHEA
jgi:RNA polymerase sigma-70 factor, ECF subfamily